MVPSQPMLGYTLQYFAKILLSIPALVVLALVGGRLLERFRPKLGRRLSGAGLLLLLLALFPPLPEWLVYTLREELPVRPGSADAIVVLGGDGMRGREPGPNSAERTAAGARLYHAGVAPLLLVTGGGPGESGTPRALAHGMARYAQSLGVPVDAILVEDAAFDTYQNATLSLPLLQARGVKRIALVTSPTHLRRAAAVFRAQGLEVLPVGSEARPTRMGLAPSFDRASQLQAAVREWIGIAWYRLRGWI
ncbi:MAG: YdcF family protein [Myxococcales bacterium]